MFLRSSSSVRTLLSVLGLAPVVGGMAWMATDPADAHARDYHTPGQLAEIRSSGDTIGLSLAQNHYFMASGRCEGCHGHDPQEYAGLTPEGVDVNVVDAWRSTMMANSARDPFWRAKVSHEGLVNPAHKDALEDKCTSCHAPAGRYDKHMLGHGLYSMSELMHDSVGLDGVNCVACHIQSADSIGLHFSGKLKFDTLNRPLYGPYLDDDIFGAPMSSFVGYEPKYGAHINDAGLCAGCHTLLTETADLSGEHTGAYFVEQATYHEWLNSIFNNREHAETGITCQGCHVPRIDEGVVLSANYIFLQPHSPFGLHHFAGANSFMLHMLKDHRDSLGVPATPTQFDSTIARTNRLLQQHSLLLDVAVTGRNEDTAAVSVELVNLVGHKFPSGYPARRMWVELLVQNTGTGDTIFHSGGLGADYEVNGHDADWEPHYDLINSPDQVQIYEMVMGDVNGDKTTVLERAAVPLKDNRLPPAGFTSTHNTYDTAVVAGVPATDLDFNRDGLGVEGAGRDVVHFRVPMQGFTGQVEFKARVWYQSAPPKWMEEMFAYNSEAIDRFRDMYQAADNTPVLVREAAVVDDRTGVVDLQAWGIRIHPNPVFNGTLTVSGLDARVEEITLFDLNGRVLARRGANRQPVWRVELPAAAGTYLLVFRTNVGVHVERVVRM